MGQGQVTVDQQFLFKLTIDNNVCHVNNEGIQNALKGIFMDICMIQNLKLDMSLFRLNMKSRRRLRLFALASIALRSRLLLLTHMPDHVFA